MLDPIKRKKYFYFVEGDRKIIDHVTETEGAEYVQKIYIEDVENALSLFKGFSKEYEFYDWVVFSKSSIRIEVALNAEQERYLENGIVRRENKIKEVKYIFFVVEGILDSEALQAIEQLMSKFSLNLYNIVENQHYLDVKDFVKLAVQRGYLKE